MKRVLVTGATGNVGRHVASRLLASNCLVRALTRNPETASVPPGVEAVRGDLTGGAALDACLEGVDAVFLVWTTPAGRCAMRRCRGNKRTGNGFPPVILTMLL